MPPMAPHRLLLLAGLGLLAAPFLGACASPLGGRDIEVAAGPIVGPGVGAFVSAAQLMLERERFLVHVEVGYAHSTLDPGIDRVGRPVDEGWDQVYGGFRVTTSPAARAHWVARGGAAWVRAQGDPEYFDDPGDYGGAYLGVGYVRRLTEHLSTGPALTLYGVLPEGSEDDGGVVPQLAWHLAWHL